MDDASTQRQCAATQENHTGRQRRRPRPVRVQRRRHLQPLPDPRRRWTSLHSRDGLLPLRQQCRQGTAAVGSQPRRTTPAGALQLQLDHHAGRPVRKRTQRARHAARHHRIHLRAQRTHPTGGPVRKRSRRHAALLTSNDLAPTPCPKCGKEPTYIHLGMSVDPRS